MKFLFIVLIFKINAVEVILLIIYGLILFWRNLSRDNNLDVLTLILERVMAVITSAWIYIHLYFDIGKGVLDASLFFLLLIIFSGAEFAGTFFSNLIIPKDPPCEWFLKPIRRTLRISITYSSFTFLATKLIPLLSLGAEVVKEVTQKLIEKVFKVIIVQSVVTFVTSLVHLTNVPQIY